MVVVVELKGLDKEGGEQQEQLQKKQQPIVHRHHRHRRHRRRRGSNSHTSATPHGDWEASPLSFKLVTSSEAGYSAPRRI